jgi:hypothetical protein
MAKIESEQKLYQYKYRFMFLSNVKDIGRISWKDLYGVDGEGIGGRYRNI